MQSEITPSAPSDTAGDSQQYRLLLDSLTDYAIYMLNPKGLVVNWNAGAERLKGYCASEIVGQHFSRFYTKEDQALGLPAHVLEVALKQGRFEGEGWRVRKDGSRFWALVIVDPIRHKSGELLGFAKITRDITERRTAQDALHASEHQFRVLIDGVADYALYMLDPNGIVTNWNAGAQRIKGYNAAEIVGQHFSRFYTDEDRAAGKPVKALHVAIQEGRYEAEGWRVRKDGSRFWANVVIDPIRDENRNLIGFAKITRDITERRDAQLALEEAQAQRAHAQKMDALGQLTGGVAHDFNNLLMIVGGSLRIIKKLLADNPKGARAAEMIELATKRGESLTRQLLTFSRRQALNPLVVQIGERLDAIRTLLTSSIGSAVEFSISAPENVWPVKIDLSEFELALVNITLNARDAMPDGGSIRVMVNNVHLQPSDLPEMLEGDFVAISIADSGMGIAPDVLAKVFDPFFTTKEVDKGTGLGLSQVHGFAHQSGGTVTIKSKPDVGTTITIYLPRSEEKPQTEAATLAEIETFAGGKALLVEDNHDVALVSAEMLEQFGYKVQSVPNGQAALVAAESQAFDLVVSDIVMPGPVDGLGVARTLRQRQPNLPILLVTGYTNKAMPAESEFSVLRKPYLAADLGRAVAKVIAESQRRARVAQKHST